MSTPVFWMEPTGTVERQLRRFVFTGRVETPCTSSYHNASAFLDIAADGDDSDVDHDDPRWPRTCAHCPYVFTDDDEWQVNRNRIYNEVYRLPGYRDSLVNDSPISDAPPGAMWDATWLPESFQGPDGIALAVCLPDNTTWLADSRAGNCTLPDDHTHKCWVRHGDPRDPIATHLTAGKDGPTCSAGAGSILSATGWHGFLTDGNLVG